MKNILKIILKLAPLQGYRRQIGLGAMLVAGVVQVLQSNEWANIPFVSEHIGVIAAVGTYVAIVGASFKDDPKTEKTHV